jgi:hypothetical protein
MNGYTMFLRANLSHARLHDWVGKFLLVLTAESCSGDQPVVIKIEKNRISDAIDSLYSMTNYSERYCTKRYLLCLYQNHSNGIMHKVGYCFR